MTNEEEKPTQEALLGEIAGTLRTIRGWMTFLGIVVLLALIGGCLMATGAFAGTALIVSSFKSPSSYPAGIDYHGGYIYHSQDRYGIYETTTTGSVVGTIRTGDQTGVGLERTDTNFWTTGGAAILKLSTTGSWTGTIPIPTKGRGVAYGGGFLWLAAHIIYKITPGGSIVTTFRVSTINPCGICYHDDKLWIIDSNIGAVVHATTTGSLIESYSTLHDPYGVTCEGEYIWYSDLKSGYVYKMLPITTAVAPASLGKVKAIYR